MKKTFFNSDISINEKLFNNFNVSDIVSWSHLELWCAIQNIEITYDFFKGILCGTSIFDNLFNIILDSIKNENFVDDFIKETETIEIIEKIYCNQLLSRTFKGKEFWIDLAYKQKDYSYTSYYKSGIIKDTNKKYKLLNAIFKKCPIVLLKFFDLNKLEIHRYDIDFERWLVKTFSLIKNKTKMYQNVFNTLQAEIIKLNKLSMYLN